MSEAKEIRDQVSRHYREAVKSMASCCGGKSQPKGVIAKLAGYDAAVAKGLPGDALENSFGCGNPLAFSSVKEGETVLDLGSGAGLDLLIAAQKVGPSGKVIGVDMTDEMIEKARRNAAKAGFTNIDVRKGIIEELPVEDASIDLLISNCVINLSPEKEKVFAEIARVLKPGGRMQVSDIVAQDLPEWVLHSMELYASCVAGAISEESYLEGLRKAGLESVDVVSRISYNHSQLEDLFMSECGCGGDADAPSTQVDKRFADKVLAEMEGKVWSAQFVARKPT